MVLTDRKVDLIEERFQLAIRIGNINDDGIVAIPLPPYRMILAASRIPATPRHAAHATRSEAASLHQFQPVALGS
jgi:DNA-binding transcriptional LysR family regulator